MLILTHEFVLRNALQTLYYLLTIATIYAYRFVLIHSTLSSQIELVYLHAQTHRHKFTCRIVLIGNAFYNV